MSVFREDFDRLAKETIKRLHEDSTYGEESTKQIELDIGRRGGPKHDNFVYLNQPLGDIIKKADDLDISVKSHEQIKLLSEFIYNSLKEKTHLSQTKLNELTKRIIVSTIDQGYLAGAIETFMALAKGWAIGDIRHDESTAPKAKITYDERNKRILIETRLNIIDPEEKKDIGSFHTLWSLSVDNLKFSCLSSVFMPKREIIPEDDKEVDALIKDAQQSPKLLEEHSAASDPAAKVTKLGGLAKNRFLLPTLLILTIPLAIGSVLSQGLPLKLAFGIAALIAVAAIVTLGFVKYKTNLSSSSLPKIGDAQAQMDGLPCQSRIVAESANGLRSIQPNHDMPHQKVPTAEDVRVSNQYG